MKDTLIGIAVIIIIILVAMMLSGCKEKKIPMELLDSVPALRIKGV